MFIGKILSFIPSKKLLMGSCAVALGIGNLGFTQDSADETRRLEEIVVTAQKRTESLQDVPIAVTVHDGNDIESDNIESLLGISGQTPGLVFTAFSVGQPEISIRGVSSKEDGASANDSVVVSIDDVYIAARTAQVFDIFDLERVEVLRGPQGTLYGKNSIGGSINFVTRKPTADTTVRFRQSFGNYGIFDSAGLISGAISENLYGKVSFSRRRHDGFLTNILEPTELYESPDYNKSQGERDNFAIRGQFVYMPNEDLEMIISIDSADDRHGATNREPIGSTGFHGNDNATNPVAVNKALKGDNDPFTTLAETEGYTDRNVKGLSVKSTYTGWNGIDFVSIASYRQSNFDWLEDSAGLPPSQTHVNLTEPGPPDPTGWLRVATRPANQGFTFDITNSAIEETQQITKEFRLVSTAQGQFSWIAGAFYSKEDIDRTERFNFTSLGIGPKPDDEHSVQANTTNSYAVYGQAEYEISEQLTFTGGLRFSSEEKDITVAAKKLNDNPHAVLLRGADFGPTAANEEFSNVSWKASLDYEVNDDVLVYGNLSTGFKSGGFTGSASTEPRATTPFDSEKALSFEAGVKSRLADNRMLFNALAFTTKYEDLQVTRFFQPAGSRFGEFITENAGEAEIQGMEIEVVGILNENFEVGGNLAWLNAEYIDFQGLLSQGAKRQDFNGNKLRLAPETTFSVYVQGDFAMNNGATVTGKAKYRYQDDMFFDPDNNPLTVSPAHSVIDLWLAYTVPDDRMEFKLFVNNATGEEYVTHAFSQRSSRIAFGLYGPPMTYGVSATYKFN